LLRKSVNLVDRSGAVTSEIDALIPAPREYGYTADWYWRLPPGTLCYVNELAGEVWLSQGNPQRRWLADLLEDAEDATAREFR
jgi:hypothetical protein